jgi:hypothetical protein
MNQKEPLCSACKIDATYLMFNWQMMMKERPEVEKTVTHLQNLKRGTLRSCRWCKKKWVLDEDQLFAYRLTPERELFFKRWNETPLTPSLEIRKILDHIGATPIDYGNGSGQTLYPCHCTFKDGTKSDFCEIVLTKMPFNFYEVGKARTLDEVDFIEPSRFAFSSLIRTSASKAQELRMGWCPWMCESPDGRLFLMNGQENFFHWNQWMGSEMKWPDDFEKDYFTYSGTEKIVLVVGDC